MLSITHQKLLGPTDKGIQFLRVLSLIIRVLTSVPGQTQEMFLCIYIMMVLFILLFFTFLNP